VLFEDGTSQTLRIVPVKVLLELRKLLKTNKILLRPGLNERWDDGMASQSNMKTILSLSILILLYSSDLYVILSLNTYMCPRKIRSLYVPFLVE
jgi:hypothetical protein